MSVTIYDVAKEAGVSPATVSKVLSGRPYVADKTRARVQDAIRKLNYVPNVAARGLAGARTHIIGIVIAYDADYLFADPHLLEILHGADQVAADQGCALLLSTRRPSSDRLAAHQLLLKRHYADGVLVDGSLGEESFALLRERGYPVVAIGYSEQVSCVHSDDRSGAHAMTEHLLALGHRRIGVISGPRSDKLAMLARLQGHQSAIDSAGIPFTDDLITYGTFRSASGYECAAQLMALPDPPTAIFAFNDRMALGAIRYLREQGLSVPGDVSVAGFDDIPSAALAEPALTTMRQQSLEQGRRAALMLFEQINTESSTGRYEVVLPTQLVPRASTGPAPVGEA